MSANISIAGIEKAVSALEYRNSRSIKYRLIHAIKQFYDSDQAHQNIQAIDPDELIPQVWDDIIDTSQLKSKRKNLNSIRSSINSDLMKLFRDGKNPEGIIIDPSNVFDMCDEAKDEFLKSFNSALASDQPVTLDSISEVARLFEGFLNRVPDDQTLKFVESILDALSLKNPLLAEKAAELLELFENINDDEKIEEVGSVDDEEEEVEYIDMESEEPEEDLEIVEEVDVVVEDEENDESDEDSEIVEEEDLSDLYELEEVEDEELDDSEIVEELDVVIEDEDEDGAEDDTESGEDEGLSELEEFEEVDADELDDSGEEEQVDEEDLDEVDELDDLVEESELVDEDDIEEVEVSDDEVEEPGEEAEIDDFEGKYDIDEDEFDFENLSETERKRVLAERFDRYLGAMVRNFNQFLLIPSGAYTIGSKVPTSGELPEQQVQVADFFMGKYPVINALFEVFVERTGYTTTAEKKGFGVVYEGRFRKIMGENTGQYRFAWNATHSRKEVKGAYWYQPTGLGSTLHQKRNHPVVQVSLLDAMAFASWVGKRLPTEAEWEATARTDKGYRFPWGDDWKDGLCNSEASGFGDTTPVDHYQNAVNKMGIGDFLGNTLEWTSEKCEPPNGSQNDIDYNIAKGGSWVSEESIQLASRFRLPTDFTSNTLGFRCLAD